jgi:predicted N-acetyltransferase YhbS
VLLRRESPTDQRAIFDVHAAAFARADGAVPVEARLVDDLRAAGDIVEPLSVVAELNGQVVGRSSAAQTASRRASTPTRWQRSCAGSSKGTPDDG